ncbi:MAG: stage III sporulation protein AE [Lachnospiraceae bacterium]|nr:stage III sporulation protein AE [Lachnospiraceae bacterium]
MRGRRKGLLGLLLSLTLLLSVYKPVCAQEEIGIGSVWEEYGLEEIGESLDRMLPGHGPDIRQILDNILAGRLGRAVELTWEGTGEQLLSELAGMKHLFTIILILGILSALFAHFSDVFSNQQIADISFYFLYLLLAAVLMKAFQEAADITRQLVGDIVYFIRLFIPAYFMAVGAAVGAATAAAYYQLLLLLAYGAESLLFSFLLPLVYTYVLLALMNGIWAEERLSLLLDFLKKGISTGLKAAIGVITSFGIFQSMITPVLDSLKNSAVKKAISAIPGIGNLAEGVTEMLFGSAVLIKNSIGLLLLLLLLAVCLIPLVKLLCIACIIKGSAALAGIVSDKRITGCTDRVGDGSLLLLKTAFTAVALFLIIIAITAYTTGRGV